MKRGIALEKWQTRYPNLAFYLSLFPYEPVELSKDPSPLLEWLAVQHLGELEVIYLIGLIDHPLPELLMAWLASKKEKSLVFVEQELGAFASFRENSLLDHPQIHFHYAHDASIDELSCAFPLDRLGVFVPEGKSFDAMTLERKSAAASALYSDVLYSHLLVKNALKNVKRLPHSFLANQWKGRWKGMPAILCGAGPSLAKALPLLKEVKDRALIVAGGSTITALTKHGIEPHLAIAFDPNQEEVDRLVQSRFFAGPFLYGLRLHADVFATVGGPFGYLKSDTGGWVESYFERQLGLEGEAMGPDLGREAFSVTTLAVSLLTEMGCSPILFAGIDLAYSGGKRYAPGVEAPLCTQRDPRALEKPLVRKNVHGQEVETLLKWVMESDVIAAFARAHPETLFLNTSAEGLGFEGIDTLPLEEALARYGKMGLDLSGKIHQMVQETMLQVDEDKLDALFVALHESLAHCKGLCEQICQQLQRKPTAGRLVLLESDFKEEEAYVCFLEGIDLALEHLLPRYFPHLDPTVAKQQRKIAKYLELQEQIQKIQEYLRVQTHV